MSYYPTHKTCFDCYWDTAKGCYLVMRQCPKCAYLEADKGIAQFTVLHGQNIDFVSLEEKWIQELLKK